MEEYICPKHEAIETRLKSTEGEIKMIKDKLYGNGVEGFLYRVKRLEEETEKISRKLDHVFILLILIMLFNFFKIFDSGIFLHIIKVLFS